MTDRSSFVVVANRLPVDEVSTTRGTAVAAQPRRPGHRPAPGARRAPGHLGRLGRRRRRRPRAVRARRHPAAPGAAQRRGARALLRGPVQRHHLAALPRRGRDPGLPAPLAGGVPAWSTRASPRPRPRSRAEGATVWVQDYQLQLVPAMLRELRPDLRIGFFLHIPFPPIELFMQLPLRAEILRGLLGADLVGFQQRLAAQNFVRLARHLLGLRYEGQTIEVDGRQVQGRRLPDLDRRRARWSGWPPTRRCRPGPSRSAPSWATRRRSSSASTGSTTPRASSSGSRPSASCWPTAS